MCKLTAQVYTLCIHIGAIVQNLIYKVLFLL
nr:MAG TPA: hypothetical protein [Caudoviricetes sp.]